MDDPLDDDALDVSSSMIIDKEEYPTHHTDSNHVRSWKPFSSDPHLPQSTLITPYEDSERVPQDESETADPEGGPEVATLRNKYTP